MRDGIIGNEFHHVLKLRNRFVLFASFFISDAEIEPRVWDRRVLLLHADEFSYAFGCIARPKLSANPKLSRSGAEFGARASAFRNSSTASF